MLKTYVNTPTFYTDTALSATDINILRSDATLLQGLSKRSSPIQAIDTYFTGYVLTLGGIVWRGGFQYKTGMTNAIFLYVANVVGSPGATPQFKIYFNGTQVHTRNLATETVTITIDVSVLGYSDNDIITVECKLTGNPEVGTGGYDATPDTYYIWSAYTEDLSTVQTSLSGAYVAPETFGDITAARLNKLGDALDWLATRLALVPYIPLMSLRNWQGTFQVELYHILSLKLYMDPAEMNYQLKFTFDFVPHSTETYIRFTVNGVNYNYGPYVDGQVITVTDAIDLSSSLSGNTEHVVAIYENLVSTYTDGRPLVKSRFTLRSISMGAPSYTYTAAPAETAMLESIPFSTVKTRLNAIKTIVDGIKTQIDNTGYVFSRAVMFRARFGNSTYQQEYWQNEHVARHTRVGDLLWVKGQGLSIGYGSVVVSTNSDEEYSYTYQYSESLTAGDQIESKFFYLDQFKGLFPGMEYYIYGKDIIYAAEMLKAV